MDVQRQRVIDQGMAALLGGAVDQLVAVQVGVLPGALLDILALIAVLGELDVLLAFVDLQVAGGQRLAEFFDLVAGVVDVELAGDLVAGPVEHAGQTVAQRAAAGVAQMHGAGGVGRDELDHGFLALPHVAAAIVVALLADGQHRLGEPAAV